MLEVYWYVPKMSFPTNEFMVKFMDKVKIERTFGVKRAKILM